QCRPAGRPGLRHRAPHHRALLGGADGQTEDPQPPAVRPRRRPMVRGQGRQRRDRRRDHPRHRRYHQAAGRLMPRFLQPTATGPLVTLEHGPYTLTVAPGFGARMVSFRPAGRDLLRSTPDAVLAEPHVYGFAGFPLMPYSGPLFGPGFTFAGITH